VLVGLVVIVVWILAAVLAPVLTPYEPLAQNVNDRLQPPDEDLVRRLAL
jgi:hypothetical protein